MICQFVIQSVERGSCGMFLPKTKNCSRKAEYNLVEVEGDGDLIYRVHLCHVHRREATNDD